MPPRESAPFVRVLSRARGLRLGVPCCGSARHNLARAALSGPRPRRPRKAALSGLPGCRWAASHLQRARLHGRAERRAD